MSYLDLKSLFSFDFTFGDFIFLFHCNGFLKAFVTDFKIKLGSHKVFVYLPNRFSLENALRSLFLPLGFFFFCKSDLKPFFKPHFVEFQAFFNSQFYGPNSGFLPWPLVLQSCLRKMIVAQFYGHFMINNYCH